MADSTEAPLPGQDDAAAYAYWDGTRRRIIDPLEAGAVLEAECPDYVELLDFISDPTPGGLTLPPGPVKDELAKQLAEKADKLLATARKMFGLKPLGEEGEQKVGLGRKGTMGVLMGYFDHMGQMAREARPFETSQPRDSPLTRPDSPAESSAASGSPGW